MNYKGFNLVWSKGQNEYHWRVFKDGNLFSCMCFRTIDVAERVIDTYLKSLENGNK